MSPSVAGSRAHGSAPLRAWGGEAATALCCPLGEDDLEALKAKNIKQTELVADLREAVLRVARHFQCTDPKNCSVVSRRLLRPCRTTVCTGAGLSPSVPSPTTLLSIRAGADSRLQHGEPPAGP